MENERIRASELIHIWKVQPCEAGDTLSGGEAVDCLRRNGLIESTIDGYITTSKGNYIVQRMIEHLDKCEIRLCVDISVLTPIDKK